MDWNKIAASTYATSIGGETVELGDSKLSGFRPILALGRWQRERVLRIYWPTARAIEPMARTGAIEWQDGDTKLRWYTLNADEQNDGGALEFEVIWTSVPSVSELVLPIDLTGLVVYRQPPLYEDSLGPNVVTATATHAYDRYGRLLAYRPENVVGSYAIYHDSRGGMHRSPEEAEKYRTGKAFHIYRPLLLDAKGQRTYADLVLDERPGLLRIALPVDWLRTAAYPVVLDPTFGYTSVGASMSANTPTTGCLFTGAAGFAQSISVYGHNAGSPGSGFAIVQHSGGTFVCGTAFFDDSISSPQWVTKNVIGAVTISAIGYVLLAHNYNYGWSVAYDSGAANQGHVNSNFYYGSWPSSFSFSHNKRKYSIYCTYISGGTSYSISVAGTTGSAGGIGRRPGNALSGATGSSGSMPKRANKAVAGTAASSGTSTRRLSRLLSGATTSTSILSVARQIAQVFYISLVGTTGSSGASVKQAAKTLSGGGGSAGVLGRLVYQMLAGATLPAGSLLKTAVRSIGGTTTSIGTLAKLARRALAGITTSDGISNRQARKVFAGATSVAGAVAKAAIKAFGGLSASVGQLATEFRLPNPPGIPRWIFTFPAHTRDFSAPTRLREFRFATRVKTFTTAVRDKLFGGQPRSKTF